MTTTPLTIKRGTTFEAQLLYKRDGAPLNLDDAGIVCISQLRNAATGDLVETLAITVQDQVATPGAHSARSAGTDNWPASILWDLRYTDGNNVLYTDTIAIRVGNRVTIP